MEDDANIIRTKMPFTLRIRCQRVNDLELQVQDSDEVSTVKERIACQKQIPKNKQTLTFQGLVLEDPYRLKQYGIKDGSTIFLSIPLGYSITPQAYAQRLVLQADDIAIKGRGD
ncbi:unnamed protein product [Dibothriocephalus latus]|uniref:Ubiquitin-like domain-containing protein n=1 Tax=Dibothriocephalus latus TaxID=60516 RepID=A0A3P6TV26_DIBLA|nr:unnamed protein product [Dibothriocephalus latus]